jgi:hypothetical protein
MSKGGSIRAPVRMLVAVSFLSTVTAAAAASNNHYAPAHPSSCWRYHADTGRWVSSCKAHWYQNAGPPSQPLFPGFGSGYYPYQFQPPATGNGPYYGYEPYNGGYQSALGLSF